MFIGSSNFQKQYGTVVSWYDEGVSRPETALYSQKDRARNDSVYYLGKCTMIYRVSSYRIGIPLLLQGGGLVGYDDRSVSEYRM